MGIVRGFKRTNPGLPPDEFKNIINLAKGRAEAFVRDTVDTAYKGTKVFGTEENYSRSPQTEEGKIFTDYSIDLAKKYGLELTPPNEKGRQFVRLDKGGNPAFVDPKAPRAFLESSFKSDMAIYKDNLSKNSQEWNKGIDQMKESKNPYAQGFASAFDSALREKYGARWGTSWKLNSGLKLKELFNLSNEEGYAYSQPFRRTAAITAGKNYSEIKKAVAKADEKTRDISEQARTARLNALGKGEDISKNLPSGMRAKDPNQIQNVSEDLTPFDMMMNGLLGAEVRVSLVDRYNNLRKEMGAGTAKYNTKIYDQMKLLFDQIKKVSANIPEEAKSWKLGNKIILKNQGNPTMEEGIKDGLRLAASIFKNKPTPGYIDFGGIRETVLKSLKK